VTRVLVQRASDNEQAVFEVAEAGILAEMGAKLGILCAACDAVVQRATLAPGCTVELLHGAFGTPWPDRLRSCVQCADQVAAIIWPRVLTISRSRKSLRRWMSRLMPLSVADWAIVTMSTNA